MDSGTICGDKVKTVEHSIADSNANACRYKKERTEMTLGSKGVGQENWVQDIDGKLGLIVGIKEFERKVECLEPALERFQLSYLFFQLGLFVGSVSLMNSNLKTKSILYWMLVGLAVIGLGLSVMASIAATAG